MLVHSGGPYRRITARILQQTSDPGDRGPCATAFRHDTQAARQGLLLTRLSQPDGPGERSVGFPLAD